MEGRTVFCERCGQDYYVGPGTLRDIGGRIDRFIHPVMPMPKIATVSDRSRPDCNPVRHCNGPYISKGDA